MRRVLLVIAFICRALSARAQEPESPCVEGAPTSDTLDDCPEPLSTGEVYHPWDDLYPLGVGLRLSFTPAPIAGPGLTVRHATSRFLTFELAADYLLGRDPYGQGRREAVLSIDALAFVHRGSDLYEYALAGVGGSYARISGDDDRLAHATYLGLRLGGGVEFKGARDLGWNIDLVGFLRTRTGSDNDDGEILDGRPDQSRLSAGGLFRMALIIYPHGPR